MDGDLPQAPDVLTLAANGATEAAVVPVPRPAYLPPAPGAATGPQPRRYQWLKLPAEYGEANMQVLVYLNFSRALAHEMASGELDRQMAAVQQIIVEHNGWRDPEGAPYPPANTRAFWDAIPQELANTTLKLLEVESQKLPSSLT